MTAKPRTALVTGSSSGIGKACCEALLANGWTVYGGSRSAVTGAGWHQLTLDVRQTHAPEQAVREVVAREGTIDALVHCAGVSLGGSVEDTSESEARALFDTNYLGTVRVIRAVLPAMRAAHSGRIVVIGSIAGRIGLPFMAHYSASKFALEGLMEGLSIEVKPLGILTTLVEPGDTQTAIFDHEARAEAATAAGSVYAQPYAAASAVYRTNVNNGLAASVVANAVLGVLDASNPPAKKLIGSWAEIGAIALKPRFPTRWFEAVIASSVKLKS